MRKPRPFNHVPVYYSERHGRVEHLASPSAPAAVPGASPTGPAAGVPPAAVPGASPSGPAVGVPPAAVPGASPTGPAAVPGQYVPARLQGVFTDGRRSRRKGRGLFSSLSIPMLLSVVLVLLATILLIVNT